MAGEESSSHLPSLKRILVIRHALGDSEKHEVLTRICKNQNIDLRIPTREEDLKAFSKQERAEFYANLIKDFVPDILIAQSSGGKQTLASFFFEEVPHK